MQMGSFAEYLYLQLVHTTPTHCKAQSNF